MAKLPPGFALSKLPEGFTIDRKPLPTSGGFTEARKSPAKLPEGFTVDTRAYERKLGREHWDKPFMSRLGETLADLGKVGAQGVTLGFSDEIAAAMQAQFGADYDEALKARQQGLAESKARMNYATPGSAAVFEGATSLVNPVTRMGILGLGGSGAASSVGHGERDPWEIAKATAIGLGAGTTGKAVSYLPRVPQLLSTPAAFVADKFSRRGWLPWTVAAHSGPVAGLTTMAAQEAARKAAPALLKYGNKAPVATWQWPNDYANYLAAGGRSGL